MTDYLTPEKTYDLLKEKLIEYQKRFPPGDDVKQQFELKIEPNYFSYLTVDKVVDRLKEYIDFGSLNPFSFLIKDRRRDRELFRICQSKRSWPGWEIRDLIK